MSNAALPQLANARLAVIGLGYVGLPLAVAFGRVRKTLGFDINPERIAALREAHDHTREIAAAEIRAAAKLEFSSSPEELATCEIFVVAVPTPIDAQKRPDLRLLEAASLSVGKAIRRGAIAIFESTVFPGATEDVCVPIIERASGLQHNVDFYTGYSPERINPGDKQHRLENIVKVTAGSTEEAAQFVDELYREIVHAGTHRAPSIRVAEMAKVIENTQRDLNIALINEVALICHRLGIDSSEVLEAAGTKWNFLPFRPGLVGGHCIGVDPYYLTHKAQAIGYEPEVILSGRRINDGMAGQVAQRVVALLERRQIPVSGARVLVLGLAFKENCPDLRNSRVIDVVTALDRYGATVDVYDPCVNADEARSEYGVQLLTELPQHHYDAAILAVAHAPFVALGAVGIRALVKPAGVVFDVKQVLPKAAVDDRL
jgi:UDP-N-acetyl-D-galactosamine dehydrogenase